MAVRNGDRDLPVKPARPPQGRVEHVRQIRGGDHDQLLPFGEPVHQRQQLRHDPFFHFSHHVLAPGRDGVDLIQKNDARALARGLLEDLPQMGFALAVELVDDLRTAHRIEVGFGFMRDRARDQSLSAAWRAMEQHALGGVDAQPLEDLRIAQRQFDHFTDALELRFQPADVLVGGGARGHFLGLLRAADDQLGGWIDQDRAFRRGALHPKVRPPAAEKSGADPVSFLYGQAVEQTADVIQVALGWPHVGRGEHDALGRTATGLPHQHELVQPRSGVFTHQSVDLDPGLPAQFLVGGHRLADSPALPGDLDQVPDGDLEFFEVFRTHAGDPSPDILAQRLADFELENWDFGAL